MPIGETKVIHNPASWHATRFDSVKRNETFACIIFQSDLIFPHMKIKTVKKINDGKKYLAFRAPVELCEKLREQMKSEDRSKSFLLLRMLKNNFPSTGEK